MRYICQINRLRSSIVLHTAVGHAIPVVGYDTLSDIF